MISAKRSLTVVVAGLAVLLVVLILVREFPGARILPWRPTVMAPVDTLNAIYGSRLETATVDVRGDLGTMSATLVSAEPTGTEPFRALGALVALAPKKREYQIAFYMPRTARIDDVVSYIWRPELRELQMLRGYYSGSMGTLFPVAYASEVDTESLAAIGSGKRPVPEFRD